MTPSLQLNGGAVRLFSWALRLSGWLQKLPGRITPPPFRLIQLGSAFWQSRALYVAARLDLATLLGDETLAADELARRASADPEALYRLLRMLAAMGVFTETAPRRFRNNRLSGWLRSDRPQSVRAMVLMHNDESLSRPWFEGLEGAVRHGGVPFEALHGSDLVALLERDEAFGTLFAEAMESVEALVGESFAGDFDWGRFTRVIDLGGSVGAKSLAILRRHPALRALVVDRLRVVARAPGHWRGRVDEGLLGRLEFRAGDLREAVPEAVAGDVYLLSAVLHGLDDEAGVHLLHRLVAAAKPAAAPIVLLEMVLPEAGADLAGASFDMQMLVGTRGRERTLSQWRELAAAAGLELREVVGLRSLGKLLVFVPK